MFGVNWVGGLVLLVLLLLIGYVVRRVIRAISGRSGAAERHDPDEGDWASRLIERGGADHDRQGPGGDAG